MAFATPTELKAQFIMPMSYERGRIRLQAQQKEASPPYRLVADPGLLMNTGVFMDHTHEYYDFYRLKLMDTIAPIDSYSRIP